MFAGQRMILNDEGKDEEDEAADKSEDAKEAAAIAESKALKDLIQTPLTSTPPSQTFPSSSPSTVDDRTFATSTSTTDIQSSARSGSDIGNKIENDNNLRFPPLREEKKEKPSRGGRKTFLHPIGRKPTRGGLLDATPRIKTDPTMGKPIFSRFPFKRHPSAMEQNFNG